MLVDLPLHADAHRPTDEQTTAMALHTNWFEALPAHGLAELDKIDQPLKPASALELTRTYEPASSNGDLQEDDGRPTFRPRSWDGPYIQEAKYGLKVNSRRPVAAPKPEEKLIGEVTAFLLIGFTVFIALVLYIVNFPDPQVSNYGNKMVSTGMSICCAVLVEKIHMVFIKPIFINPFGKAFEYEYGSVELGVIEFVFSFIMFLIWFCAISGFACRYRDSRNDLYAVKAFIAHVTAFMAIHTFGYMEKHTCKKSQDFESGIVCYAGWPAGTLIVVYVCGHLGILVRAKLQPGSASPVHASPATNEADAAQPVSNDLTVSSGKAHDQALASGHGEHHADQWIHTAVEGEADVRAIVVSFLVRQFVLFLATGRIPSTKGDLGHHGREEWEWLFGSVALIGFILLLSTVLKEKMHWRGEEGPLGEGMVFSQLVSAMSLGWCLLTVCHWTMQSILRHPAAWNIGTAFAVSPGCFFVIILVDKLGDFKFIGPTTEPLLLDSAGLVLGFSWEVAFASGIETLLKKSRQPTVVEFGMCLMILLMIWPAWRAYIVPRAALPVPSRELADKK